VYILMHNKCGKILKAFNRHAKFFIKDLQAFIFHERSSFQLQIVIIKRERLLMAHMLPLVCKNFYINKSDRSDYKLNEREFIQKLIAQLQTLYH